MKKKWYYETPLNSMVSIVNLARVERGDMLNNKLGMVTHAIPDRWVYVTGYVELPIGGLGVEIRGIRSGRKVCISIETASKSNALKIGKYTN